MYLLSEIVLYVSGDGALGFSSATVKDVKLVEMGFKTILDTEIYRVTSMCFEDCLFSCGM